MNETKPFSTVITALLNESEPFPAKLLHRFSDIETSDLKSVLEAWPRVSTRRKEALLEDLEDLAEADTLMSFDDLARSLLGDADPKVRIHAIQLLWECDDRKLVSTFLEMLSGDESPEVRAAAASALGLFIYKGELEEIPSETLHEVEEALLEAHRTGESLLIRLRALEALGASSREEIPGLIEAAYARRDEQWLVSALHAMGRSGDDQWKKKVLAQFQNPDDEVRSEAFHAAGELELSLARLPLLDQLEDEEDLELRREIIWALSRIGGAGVRQKLEELLDGETDDEEAGFLEEALDNLLFTEDLNQFEMFDYDPDAGEEVEDAEGEED